MNRFLSALGLVPAAQYKQTVKQLRKAESGLAEAQRQLTLAREELTAVNVKLDILEGAANVLDARLRTAAGNRRGTD